MSSIMPHEYGTHVTPNVLFLKSLQELICKYIEKNGAQYSTLTYSTGHVNGTDIN